ncbi:MAG: CPBP family intramembrane metalloprotease [Oscillospiraceae bacterium]|nr:CPBP family intramembrane metalloprotease [Oscillospiraceae bacterium]
MADTTPDIIQRNLTYKKIAIYLIIFFAIWSVRELVIQPVFLTPLSNVASEIIGEIIKLLVWTVPAILLIRHYHADMWIGLREMFTNKKIWFKDAYLLLLIFSPLLRAGVFGGFAINPDFEPIRMVGTVAFVGITEELVFRGFLLNAFLKKMKMPYAIALDAVLFLLIHFPIWIYRGFTPSEFLSGIVAVPILSVLFAYSFIKTRNIFVPIVLHMLWNLQVSLFIT